MQTLFYFGSNERMYEHLLEDPQTHLLRFETVTDLIREASRTRLDGIMVDEKEVDADRFMEELTGSGYPGPFLLLKTQVIIMVKDIKDRSRRILVIDYSTVTDSILQFISTCREAEAANFRGYEIPLVGSSREMMEVKELVSSYVASPDPVFIIGESGTGKGIIAKSLHECSGCTGAFQNLNCSSIQGSLFESEMFGHTKGSFTGAVGDRKGLLETAQDGTVFLDEIGDLPMDQQPKLLKAIEEKQFRKVGSSKMIDYNARFVSATNKKNVSKEKFRQDLFFRISTLSVSIPPLRDHVDDLPELVHHLLWIKHPQFTISEVSYRTLMEYDWPGNVRQLGACLDFFCNQFDSTKVLSINKAWFDTYLTRIVKGFFEDI